MNIERELFEKLAVEHGMSVLKVADAYSNDDTNYAWWVWQKARATSNIKPVAWRWMWKNGGYRGDRDYLDWGYKDTEPKKSELIIVEPLYTHPPATVPLEKYNKLLDAFKSARNTLEFANELGGPISDTIWHGEAQTLFDFMDSIIAEAEGKEG